MNETTKRIEGANPVPTSALSDDDFVDSAELFSSIVSRRDGMADTRSERSLPVADGSIVVDTQQGFEERTPARTPRWRPVAVGFVAVVVVVAAAAGIGALMDDGTAGFTGSPTGAATLTFDGESASYSGPTTWDASTTVALVNESDQPITFGWNLMNDPTITMEEEIAFSESHRGADYEIPPWVADHGPISESVKPGETRERTPNIASGTGLLHAWDGTNRILYPATHITFVNP